MVDGAAAGVAALEQPAAASSATDAQLRTLVAYALSDARAAGQLAVVTAPLDALRGSGMEVQAQIQPNARR